jgi:HEAT repeat protein
VLDVAMADTDASVRSMAVRSLGLLAVDGAAERLRTALTKETTPEVRLLVIQQLETRRDRQSLPQLRKLAQSPVETLRSAAARAVRTIESPAPPAATP